MQSPSFLELPGKRIAYHLSEGSLPCVIFFGGFKSDMTGAKATALERFCTNRGQRFVRFDYTGHGKSSGTFNDGCIGDWKKDGLAILDALGSEKNILIGSSMGAWLAMLSAMERQEKIQSFIGIASAPDFTERLIWDKLEPSHRKQLAEEGVIHLPSCYGEEPYPITRKLIEEARSHLLLPGKIPLTIPVRLIHGEQDEDVPWEISVKLMQCLASTDVNLTLVKGGNHRMSEPENIALLCGTLNDLIGM